MIREDIILELIKNKSVLDVGSVGQSQKYGLWSLMKKQAKSLLGIDIEDSNDKDIVKGNIENYKFNKKFDVVIAGDLIEHLDNPGMFLDNINKCMHKDSILIITTPNAKWFTVILKPNPTHTLWHDKYTLSYLLNKHKFKIEYFRYYPGNKLYYNLVKRLLAFRQGIFVICKKSF